jgi:hypothetical protein
MVSYKVVNVDQNKLRCDILETATDQLVVTDMPLSEAKDRCKEFNFGAFFDGWTPPFFLIKTRNAEAA